MQCDMLTVSQRSGNEKPNHTTLLSVYRSVMNTEAVLFEVLVPIFGGGNERKQPVQFLNYFWEKLLFLLLCTLLRIAILQEADDNLDFLETNKKKKIRQKACQQPSGLWICGFTDQCTANAKKQAHIQCWCKYHHLLMVGWTSSFPMANKLLSQAHCLWTVEGKLHWRKSFKCRGSAILLFQIFEVA